ncbi:MAG: SagB/ThcOx family dehydrogenase [Halobacteriota archaeon]
MVDARTYHERTKHDPEALRADAFVPDPDNRPRDHKVYRDGTDRDLPLVHAVRQPALATIATPTADPNAGTSASPAPPFERSDLATVLYLANGIVNRVHMRGERVTFRAASCTGRLYHIECYLVCGPLADLPAGVYHFDPESTSLTTLRTGDHRGALVRACGGELGVASAPAAVVLTSTWWRNAWKYRDRTYRHAFWDGGTVLANLLATAHALDRRAAVVGGFVDDEVATLLGVEPDEEAPIAVAPLGRGATVGASPPPAAIDPPIVDDGTVPREHPLIRSAYRQSTLADPAGVEAWRDRCLGNRPLPAPDEGDGVRIDLDPVGPSRASARPLWETVHRRGSKREFADTGPTRRQLGTVLDRALVGAPADWNAGAATGLELCDAYVLATGVDELEDGTYHLGRTGSTLERLGRVTPEAKTHLALDQPWAGDAQVNVYLMADLEAVVDRLGDRGYRLAQLEAGVALGRLYLATSAHRALGGTGLTFYDDAVTDHLAPRAAGRTPMCLFAFGWLPGR